MRASRRWMAKCHLRMECGRGGKVSEWCEIISSFRKRKVKIFNYVLMCVSLCSELLSQRPCSPEMTSVYGAFWRNALEWWDKQQLGQKCSVQTKHEIWTCKRDILLRLWCRCPHVKTFLFGNTLSLQELSKITMPIVFNEPLSFLQRITEYMEHTYLIHKACTHSDSIERMQVSASGSLIIYFHMCACMEDSNK